MISIREGLLHGPKGQIPIPRTPAKVLQILMDHKDHLVEPHQLADALRAKPSDTTDIRPNVRQHVFKLRRMVVQVSDTAQIETRGHWGFVFRDGPDE